ncbi:MAG: MotA/TolQ/ExbB proton channel family protein [Victivallales bacterium]|nr:MotA/TolQ/ExbB proton channel family protein [Victivallales bacterium]
MKHLLLPLAIFTLSMMIPRAWCQQPAAREAEVSPASAGAQALPKATEALPTPRLASEAPAPAVAPEAPAASPGEDKPAVAGQDGALTLTKIFERGGWVMYVIAALSFVALALIIFYILTLRAQVLFPEDFILDAEDAAVNGDWDGLRALCRNNSSPAARIIEASLEQIVPGQPWNYDRIQAAMEDEGARQAGFLWQRLQYLMDVAIIAPMVGLLGTVWGMMLSFAGIENGADFASKAETMASGIAQAMYTTFGGLIVGILAMAIYDLIRGHLNRIISAMERACGTVLRKLTPPSGGMSPVRK